MGNARIMVTSIDREDLHRGNIKDYMTDTANVGASCYSWASVLYDQEYRCRQAAACFRWGADSQHQSTILLKEKSTVPGQVLPKQCTVTIQRLGSKKSASSSMQGNACTVESVTLNMSAQYACRPTPNVTTTRHKPSPSRTRMSCNQQIR